MKNILWLMITTYKNRLVGDAYHPFLNFMRLKLMLSVEILKFDLHTGKVTSCVLL